MTAQIRPGQRFEDQTHLMEAFVNGGWHDRIHVDSSATLAQVRDALMSSRVLACVCCLVKWCAAGFPNARGQTFSTKIYPGVSEVSAGEALESATGRVLARRVHNFTLLVSAVLQTALSWCPSSAIQWDQPCSTRLCPAVACSRACPLPSATDCVCCDAGVIR